MTCRFSTEALADPRHTHIHARGRSLVVNVMRGTQAGEVLIYSWFLKKKIHWVYWYTGPNYTVWCF